MPFAIEPSDEISNRVDFAHLCNARGYKDAVEVGVDHGVFAREFLSRWNGHWLILLDPYRPYAEMPYDRMIDAFVAAQALAPFHGRFRFVRAASPMAIPWVQTFVAPEFVYIDGSHVEAEAYADMVAWWEILPSGGMLAGHDYDPAHPGVMAAVERFARERQIVVRLTHEKVGPPSWYCYRGEPTTTVHKFFRDEEVANPRATV